MGEVIEYPTDPIEAFSGDGPGFLESRITFFLLLGALFGGGGQKVREDAEKTMDQFRLPRMKEPILLNPSNYLQKFTERYGLPIEPMMGPHEGENIENTSERRNIARELVGGLYNNSNPETVADLILLGLGDDDEFIRVCAAISYLDIFDEVTLGIRSLISISAEHPDNLAGVMAQTALQRFSNLGPTRPSKGLSQSSLKGTQTAALIVHGTIFQSVGKNLKDWWKPGKKFHSYIKKNHFPNLYSKPDYYNWSGGWSDHARKLGAIELRDWVRNRNLTNIDVLAHSHGGNMTMWATQLGLEIDNLVLLSCPVHLNFFQPEFARVKNVISNQIHMDWVILADRGGTYFNHPKIDDRVHNKWFHSHEDTHNQGFWSKYKLTI